jgi:polysaccharide export outer membrane protein
MCLVGSGCHTLRPDPRLCASPIPRELTKVSLPTYTIEPPDILLVDAVQVIPKPPYRVQPLDALFVQVSGVLPEEPIAGIYSVETDGTLNLGLSYGAVQVLGKTLPEVKEEIEKHLKGQKFKEPRAIVSLNQSRALQQIRGDHLVRPDGTLSLGTYGSVALAGMTLAEAEAAIESHLAQFLLDPDVSVDVLAYNSKVYYVILDGGGAGQQVVRLPVTGNETVLDAISLVSGLTSVSSKDRIWVARPAPACAARDRILPVDWEAISTRGRTESNYQLLPGDRVYVAADRLMTIDIGLAKVLSPIERIFGVMLLGNGAIRAVDGQQNQFGQGF